MPETGSSDVLGRIDNLIKFVETHKLGGDGSEQKEAERVARGSKGRVCVTGAGGFIGGHLCKRLQKEGYYVVGADWKNHEHMESSEFCDEFYKVDLRKYKNCLDVTRGCIHVYNLAADMGGMGFIQSNESVLFWNNTMISSKVLEASRRNKVQRYFYSSSACCYNEKMQLDIDNPGLKEVDAWPAWPQDTYGLEKLYAEELAMIYGRDFEITTRMARFHNIYGPVGTWHGGREKAPAAFCRKAAAVDPSKGQVIEIWGDGLQTRSFCYVDDCVEGILRIMFSNYDKPLNLGSDEMISINDLARMALSFEGKDKTTKLTHIKGPMGVRGRNSENTLIKQVLGWAPQTSLYDGMKKTYVWVKAQMEREIANGSKENYLKSTVVQQSSDILDSLDLGV